MGHVTLTKPIRQ